ncbi:MAG: hypothetical protein ACFNUU_03655 [Campylobacter sp.]|uniref:hypothetical protein n=1 Tax=Campylobacter sp. TaxID=205 RepID=UPI003605BD20
MKIISKFKDNYDFMVSKYGLDETLIYDRRNSTPVGADELWSLSRADKPFLENAGLSYKVRVGRDGKLSTDFYAGEGLPKLLHSVIFIGKNLVHIFAAEGKIYTNFDLAENEREEMYFNGDILTFKDRFCAYIASRFESDILRFAALRASDPAALSSADRASEKEKLSAPIVFFKRTQTTDLVAINPQLSAMGLYLDADFVWQSLVEFLSAKKDAEAPVGMVPNEIKIASKGFDAKRSFRPKMK